MNKLLIIGAGDHSEVVCEIAKACGFTTFLFLDDSEELIKSGKAYDKVSAMHSMSEEYEYAFVSIGNNMLRNKLIDELLKFGYKIPVLVHPTAFVSSTAVVSIGSLVAPCAVVGANSTIGKGCFISYCATVDHNVTIGDYSHIDSRAVCESYSHIEPYTKVTAGDIVRR